MRFESEEIQQLLKEADGEVERLTAEVASLQHRIDAWAKIRDGLLALSPSATIPSTAKESVAVEESGTELQGMEAIVAIFKEHEGEWISTDDFLKEYQRRGWLADSPNPAGTIRVNLREVRRRFADHIEERQDPADRRYMEYRWTSEISEGPS